MKSLTSKMMKKLIKLILDLIKKVKALHLKKSLLNMMTRKSLDTNKSKFQISLLSKLLKSPISTILFNLRNIRRMNEPSNKLV